MIRTKPRSSTACRVVYDAPGGPSLTGDAGQLVPVSSPRYDAARQALAQAWAQRPPACTAARAEYENAVMRAARAEVRAAWIATAEQWGIDPDPLYGGGPPLAVTPTTTSTAGETTMRPHTKDTAPTGTGPATIPDYAHPVPVGADGIRFRKVHGPRTQESTERRSQYRAAVAQELTARARSNPFTRADYMAVTP